MIKIVCNGCGKTQDAVDTAGFIPRPLTPWLYMVQEVKDDNGISTSKRDINLCKECANKAGLR